MQQTPEMQVWSLAQEDHLEEEMASHSGVPAWGIPWTEEPGGLWSMVSQSQTQLSSWVCMRARTHAHTHTHTVFIYFWLCWVFIATRGLSLVAASGVYLHCGARASHSLWEEKSLHFSCFRAQALGTWASAVAAHRINSCDKQAH